MKIIYIFFTAFVFSFYCSSQVLCIKCYNQNARVLTDTNNLIVNGGFENTTCQPYNHSGDTSFCPNSWNYYCDISNWICTGGGIHTYAHIIDSSFSIIAEGNVAVYFGNNFCNSCSSNTNDISCLSNVGCEVLGVPPGYPLSLNSGYGGDTGVSLSQTINGLTTGAIYILEFWAGGEYDGNVFFSDGLFAVNVGFGNIFLRDLITPPDSGIGTRYIIIFTADSSAHTIKFTNWGHIGGNTHCTELVLDDVRLFASNGEGDPCATGINEHTENEGVSVFPNPLTSSSVLQLNTQLKNAEVVIYDVLGKEMIRRKMDGDRMEIERGVLVSGVYFVRVSSEERQWVEKMVVQ